MDMMINNLYYYSMKKIHLMIHLDHDGVTILCRNDINRLDLLNFRQIRPNKGGKDD